MRRDQVLATDLCIIGAGAAGITLALAFADQAIDVCLIEAGGFDFDPDGQELYRVETAGVGYALVVALALRLADHLTSNVFA